MKHTIASLSDFIKHVDKYKGTCFFRGQAMQWELQPTLYRNSSYMINEHRMLDELAIKHPKEFSEVRGAYPQLLKAQHYGLPTRLLDITTNPLIALYFAVSDESKKKENGHVLVINDFSENDEVCEEYKKLIALIAVNKNMNSMSTISKKIQEKDNDILDCTIPEVFIVKTKYEDSNDRSFLQGGHSIVFGIKLTNDNCVDKSKKIVFPTDYIENEFIIPFNKKQEIIKQLDLLYGISERTLLISVENTTSSIKQMYSTAIEDYEYEVNLVDPFCMDILLRQKYSYSIIEQIVKEVDEKYYIALYRVYIAPQDLSYLNLICLAQHSKKFFDKYDSINIQWFYNYDSRRIYQRNDENSNEIIVTITKDLMDIIIDVYKNRIWDETTRQKFFSAKKKLNGLIRGDEITYKLYEISYELSNEILSFLKSEYGYSKEKIDQCIIEYEKELSEFI